MKNQILPTIVSFICLFVLVVGADINIRLGDSLEQVKSVLGTPNGIAKSGNQTIYLYDGGDVIFENGKAVQVPQNYEAAALEKQQKDELYEQKKQALNEYAEEQKAKGLVWYDKQWVTPEQKRAKETAIRNRRTAAIEAEIARHKAANEAARRKKTCRGTQITGPGMVLEKHKQIQQPENN